MQLVLFNPKITSFLLIFNGSTLSGGTIPG